LYQLQELGHVNGT